jgi:hypothetical protein
MNYFDLFRNCADYFRNEISVQRASATDFDWKEMVLSIIKRLKEHESTEEEAKAFSKDMLLFNTLKLL